MNFVSILMTFLFFVSSCGGGGSGKDEIENLLKKKKEDDAKVGQLTTESLSGIWLATYYKNDKDGASYYIDPNDFEKAEVLVFDEQFFNVGTRTKSEFGPCDYDRKYSLDHNTSILIEPTSDCSTASNIAVKKYEGDILTLAESKSVYSGELAQSKDYTEVVYVRQHNGILAGELLAELKHQYKTLSPLLDRILPNEHSLEDVVSQREKFVGALKYSTINLNKSVANFTYSYALRSHYGNYKALFKNGKLIESNQRSQENLTDLYCTISFTGMLGEATQHFSLPFYYLVLNSYNPKLNYMYYFQERSEPSDFSESSKNGNNIVIWVSGGVSFIECYKPRYLGPITMNDVRETFGDFVSFTK